MKVKVFIENERGSNQKHLYDEKKLELKKVVTVSREYPFPYGFVLATTSGDGDNLDCFVLTDKPLKTGDVVEVEPIGLLEQIEDGEKDHNVLATLVGESAEVTDDVQQRLTDFVDHVFDHRPNKVIRVGSFLGRDAAIEEIKSCLDEGGVVR